MTDKLKTASVLAFERKLDTSDALFAAGNWDKRSMATSWPTLTLREKAVRGTISNRPKKGQETKDYQDSLKMNAAIENPNLQTVDICMLPHDADTLRVHFTLRILGNLDRPSACNNADYLDKLCNTIHGYAKATQFKELGRRYAQNLANARFLWRNRAVAEEVEIHVQRRIKGEVTRSWTFNALEQPWRDFPDNAKTTELGEVIACGLRGDDYVLLEVTAFARVGKAQEVFPSQEFIMKDGKISKPNRGEKSKVLYDIAGIAAMHSQKIGNAIRTIDTWYPPQAGDATQLGPIAVEPYGSVTSQGKAYRQPKDKHDFYTLLDRWILKDEKPSLEDQHYIMAVLIRGGVFGDSDK